MPLTARSTESAFLTAKARVEEWKEKFLERYMQEDRDLQLLLVWNRIPDEVKAELKRINPEAFAKLEAEAKEAEERSRKNGTVSPQRQR